MIYGKRIYLDTAPIIYLLDRVEPWFSSVADFICANVNSNNEFFTSTITATEYLPIHIKCGDFDKLSDYEAFKNLFGIKTIETTENISVTAANIRAKYKSIKSMDALHLSTCVSMSCDVFLTNDKQLLQVDEVNSILVDDL